MGSKLLGLNILKALRRTCPESIQCVITIDDRNDSRSVFNDFQDYALDENLDLFIVNSQKNCTSTLRKYKADICFVSGWYWLIDEACLSSIPEGIYGFHPSLLPQYRGGSPLVWQLINGETTIGGSIFEIGKGMDDGDIIHQVRVKVCESDRIADVLSALEEKIISDIGILWKKLLDGTAKHTPQNHKEATYASLRRPEDGLINWTQNATTIHNFIRAQSRPYPGAFTILNGQKIIIHGSQVFPNKYFCVPGQVIQKHGDRALIGCGGNTAIWVHDISIDNQPQDTAAVFSTIKIRLAAGS